MEFVFLTIEMLAGIHEDQIKRYGGSSGIRDQNLLLSALEMPQSGFAGEFFHKDVFEMAAAYLFHICKNHPFVDGNKRVAATAAWTFLRMNGIRVYPPEDDFEKLVLNVATGHLEKSDIAEFFHKWSE